VRFYRLNKWFCRLLTGAGVLAAAFLIAVIVFSLCSRPTRLAFAPTPDAEHHPSQAAGITGYARGEVDTFYTVPEWYIVWSYQAKADFQSTRLPSGYSWFGDIGQYWQSYSSMFAATRRVYPFAAREHIMLAIIGTSFTVEYALKGAYEETIGRLSEWTSGQQMVAEDDYAAKVAEDYAAFVHIRPFYEYSFAHALNGLWRDTPFHTTHLLRSVERRAWLSLDYSVESVYCELIELATHVTYGYEDVNTAAWIDLPAGAPSRLLTSAPGVTMARSPGPNSAIVEIPRYQPFTPAALALIHDGMHFRQIAGNELIVLTVIAPNGQTRSDSNLQVLLAQPLLTVPGYSRAVVLVRVSELNEVLPELEQRGIRIEHVYDY
jgi:hypothetical protein